jgi:pseudouridylate synthase I
MNVLATIAFDGTNYSGFQVQKNAITVCEVFQDAMEKIFGERIPVIGCSRTDSGVHAKDYKVQFLLPYEIQMRKLPLSFNAHLPPDIRVLKTEVVKDDFHARYDVKSKKYVYYIYNSAIESPFTSKYCYRTGVKIDIDAMQAATLYFLGTHNFASFMSLGSSVEDTVRTIFELQVQKQENEITISVEADGFLYNMVRIIAGTLLEVGKGKKTPDEITAIIKGENRKLAGPTLPAKGLFLEEVKY